MPAMHVIRVGVCFVFSWHVAQLIRAVSDNQHCAGQSCRQPCPKLLAAMSSGSLPLQSDMVPSGQSASSLTPTGEDRTPTGTAQEMGRCSFECGPPRPVAQLFRSNPRAAPRCHPCNNAAKVLSSVASKNPDDKLALETMRKQDPEMWKAKVRACRIIDPTVSGQQPGVLNAAARKSMIVRVVEAIGQSCGTIEEGGVKWITESDYKRWLVDKGQSEEQTAQIWSQKLGDANVDKMHQPGDQVRMAVILDPVTKTFRKRQLSRTVECTSTIDSAAQADDALQQLATVGGGPSALNGPLFQGMTGALRPGVAAGSTGGPPMASGPLLAPPTTSLIPATHWEGPFQKHRKLAGQVSEPLDDAPKKGRKSVTSHPALAGVTGQLLDIRQ